MPIKTVRTLILAALALAATQAQARLSSLSPWSLQDRKPTQTKTFDQSVGFQAGSSGITPAGTGLDSKFMAFPYQAAYGLTDKVELGAAWGLAWVDRKNSSSQFGVSDLAIAGRYRFFDADHAQKNPGLDVEFGFSLPTASFDKGLGTGGFGVIFGWGLVLPLDPVRAHFGLGYRLNTENSDNVKVGNVFSYALGLSVPWAKVPRMPRPSLPTDLTLEIKGFNRARTKVKGSDAGQPSPDELYLAPGADFELSKRFRLTWALMIGLTSDASDIGTHLELRF